MDNTVKPQHIVVRRTGRTWSIFVAGVLVEGGFFTYAAAQRVRVEMIEASNGGLR